MKNNSTSMIVDAAFTSPTLQMSSGGRLLATSAEGDAILWKEYLKAVEKYNKPILASWRKLNDSVMEDHKKEVAKYDAKMARIKRLEKIDRQNIARWEKFPFWKKFITPRPQEHYYSRPLYPYLLPLFWPDTKEPTYEDFLTWLSDEKKFKK